MDDADFFDDPALAMAGEDALVDAPPSAPEPQLALYRRYRPDNFSEVIGQEHVTEPLMRALANNRVNHAYLFSGPRGCGKTTSARILARALNCAEGPTPTPCGKCQSCRDLARGGGGSIDVIEIDAASHGGVEDARGLRESAFFVPVQSRYKVYIVDEAHMVTTAGFNAMLKVVEEPPPHVKFIFATTEPEKVIGTIRSRTHHYPFRLVPPRVLGNYLAEVCEQEGISVEPAVLPLVVRAGAGSVRDSLSVLDQLLGAASEDGVAYADAAALLGFTPDSLLDEIVDAIAAGDGAGVFSCVDKVIEVGQDPRRFAEDLLERFRDLIVVAAVPDALTSGLVEVSGDQAERLRNQSSAMGRGELTRAAEVLATGLTEMRGTTAPRLHLELMCSRIMLPGADVDERGLHARIERLERRLNMASLPDEAPAESAPRQRPEQATSPEPPAQPERPRPTVQERPRPTLEDRPRPESQAERPQPDRPRVERPRPTEPAPQGAGTEEPPAQQPAPQPVGKQSDTGRLATADVRRLWPDVLEEVKSRRRFVWMILSQNAHVLDLDGDQLVLAFTNEGARSGFLGGDAQELLHQSLVAVLGADLRIETTVDARAVRDGEQRSRSRESHGDDQEDHPPVPVSTHPGPPHSTDSVERSPMVPGSDPGVVSVPVARSATQSDEQPAQATAPRPDAVGDPAAFQDDEPPVEEPPPDDELAAPSRPAPITEGDLARLHPVLDRPRPGGTPPVAEPERPTARPQQDPPARPTPDAPHRPADPDPHGWASAAKERIRTTHHGAPATVVDEVPDRDDPTVDSGGETEAELLRRHLGAELIGEEPHSPA